MKQLYERTLQVICIFFIVLSLPGMMLLDKPWFNRIRWPGGDKAVLIWGVGLGCLITMTGLVLLWGGVLTLLAMI
jgi:hypothetical protein